MILLSLIHPIHVRTLRQDIYVLVSRRLIHKICVSSPSRLVQVLIALQPISISSTALSLQPCKHRSTPIVHHEHTTTPPPRDTAYEHELPPQTIRQEPPPRPKQAWSLRPRKAE